MNIIDGVEHVTPSAKDLSTILLNVSCTFKGCNKSFRTSSARKFHLEKVHKNFSPVKSMENPLVWYHCPAKLCPYHVDAPATNAKHFLTKGCLKQHWLKLHAPRVLQCSSCNLSFSCQRLLSAHRRSCGLDLKCSLCMSSFSSIESLQSHCRRLGHTPHQQSQVLIRERLSLLAQEKGKYSSSCLKNAHKEDNSLFKTAQDNAQDPSSVEKQSISLLCDSPSLDEESFSSTENNPIDSLSIIMVGDSEETPNNFQLALPDRPQCRPTYGIPSSLFSKEQTLPIKASAGHFKSFPKNHRVCGDIYKCTHVKKVTKGNSSIVSFSSLSNETEFHHQIVHNSQNTSLSVPVSIRSPGFSSQPHLLAAIALSELAASAIKRVPGVNVSTQTESGRGAVVGRQNRRPSGAVARRRALRSRQTAQTQTRLTTKASRSKMRPHLPVANLRRRNHKRLGDDYLTTTTLLHAEKSSNLGTTASTLKPPIPAIFTSLVSDVNKLPDCSEKVNSYSKETFVCPEKSNSNVSSNYFVIEKLDALTSAKNEYGPVSAELPLVTDKRAGTYSSCSSQTEACATVGMGTRASLCEGITLTLIDKYGSQNYQDQSNRPAHSKHSTEEKSDTESSWRSQLSSDYCSSDAADSTGSTTREGNRGALLQDAIVQNDDSNLSPENFKYTGGYLVGDKDEVLLEDHNFGDINYGEVLKQSSCLDQNDTCPSSARISHIETQTEHDILLGLSATSASPYHECNEHEFEHLGDESSSAWCSIETQTYEDFSAIEQYLCSTTQTQTSDEVRRELFPELNICHSQTQTVLDDLPSLVHSHTQTQS
ncbi:uncharacterized protein LOC108678271 [Hyalella azteca]|uniref:Uncharacterized protein LOC108678271 n=1 Tax=Hyalella azteca TaxID=294128 RepID=A0A8B7P8J3_HYAAZ|nr:uncharacterized protein LOC108678271 [Hyalella azteca]